MTKFNITLTGFTVELLKWNLPTEHCPHL